MCAVPVIPYYFYVPAHHQRRLTLPLGDVLIFFPFLEVSENCRRLSSKVVSECRMMTLVQRPAPRIDSLLNQGFPKARNLERKQSGTEEERRRFVKI